MIDELTKTAKQVGVELIDMSNKFAEDMQTWKSILDENPESQTAIFSAGFVKKASVTHGPEFVIDVQAPPNEKAILRTWAIETKVGNDQKEYFNNIQLTFEADDQQVRDLIAKGEAITREDIRLLLQSQTSRLVRITVSNESGGDGIQQTHGERYDFTIDELGQHPDDLTKVTRSLRVVLRALQKSFE